MRPQDYASVAAERMNIPIAVISHGDTENLRRSLMEIPLGILEGDLSTIGDFSFSADTHAHGKEKESRNDRNPAEKRSSS